jgi:circadian clock protein KaiC
MATIMRGSTEDQASNPAVEAGLLTARLRSELRRLFPSLKERDLTAVITGERGDGALTRHGIEEYVSDCVIVLDHLVSDQISTRRIRVLKYRGSLHGTDEYPFLIGARGISVQPITSVSLEHGVSNERVSMGVARLDGLLGHGAYRRSSVLISGMTGTGKTTLTAQFCDAACRRGERALYCGFEESPAKLLRNVASAGIDLGQWVERGLLKLRCIRPTRLGLEAHLTAIQELVDEFGPEVVVVDPITDLIGLGTDSEVSSILTRQVDFLLSRGVTALFTSRFPDGTREPENHLVASLIDTWILLDVIEGNGEYNRVMSVRKSRGMAHSNQVREYVLTDHGIELTDVYLGPHGVLTGAARSTQEAKERSDGVDREEDCEQRRVNLEHQRRSMEAQVAALRREFAEEADAVTRFLSRGSESRDDGAEQRLKQGRLRHSDPLEVTR